MKNNEQLWSARTSMAAALVFGMTLVVNAGAQTVANDLKTPAEPVVKTAAIQASVGEQPIVPHSTRTATRVPHVVMNDVLWSTDADGSAWVRGEKYKARFDGTGATVIPFLGSRAPRNHPVTMALAELKSGTQSFGLDAQPTIERDGARVIFHRGPVDELYDAQLQGLEHSFVVREMPRDADLSLFVSIESDMTARERAADIELSTTEGGLHYGRAVVIDADGRQAAAPTRVVAGGIEIDVPRAFLAGARFPITIDPMIATFTIDADLDEDFAPDVSYDAATHRFVTVYEQTYSGADHDVRYVVTDDNGNQVTTGIIDSSASDWRNPHIANNRIMSEFLVAADVGPVGSRDIQGRMLSAATFTNGPYLTLSGNGAGDKFGVDVGGDSSLLGPTYFLVAFERVYSATDSDILASLIDINGAIVAPSTILVDNSSNTLDKSVSVSSSTGAGTPSLRDWTLVWQREYSQFDHDIRGAQVHWDGAITTPSFSIDSSTFDDFVPSVSTVLNGTSGPLRYAVAFERHDMGGHADVMVDVLAGSSIQLGTDVSVLEGTSSISEEITPKIDSDGSQFVVTHAEAPQQGTPEYDVYLSCVYTSGSTIGLSENHVHVTGLGFTELTGGLVSCASCGGQPGKFMLGWTHRNLTVSDVFGSLYAAPHGLPGSIYCFGTAAACPCGNAGVIANGCASSVNSSGAHLDMGGLASVSNDSFVLEASGMPATGTSLFFQGTGQTNAVFGDGLRCVNGAIVRLGGKVSVGGSATYPSGADQPVSVHGNVPQIGGVRYYQVWYRNAGNFCTASTFNLTNGVMQPWVP